MATSTHIRSAIQLKYECGATYNYSRLKSDLPDNNLKIFVHAISTIQGRDVDRVFLTDETEISA